jgi:hypothetical protein
MMPAPVREKSERWLCMLAFYRPGGIVMQCSYYKAAVVATSLLASPVHSAVVGSSADGFTVREQVEFAGSPASAWKRLIDVGSWWNPQHTYSGRSSNLTLTLSPGGCWCEQLENGGFVRHLEVVLVIPEKTLRLNGGLGPLQGIGATGALTFTLRSTAPTATTVIAEYSVVGYSPDGLSSMAGAVDQVLGEQLQRFAAK